MSSSSRDYESALFWFDDTDDGWYRREKESWVGWRGSTKVIREEWMPWTELKDESRSPYVSWFRGARTNVTFTALDAHCLQGYGDDIAFDCSIDHEYVSLTRRQLLEAVSRVSSEKFSALKGSQRCFFHAHTGIEHVVYMLACARLGIVYTCTAMDASDSALVHRLTDFLPTVVVSSSNSNQRIKRIAKDMSHIQVWYDISNGEDFFSGNRGEVAPIVAVDDGAALCVVYTSGSTGKPKGIVHGHGGYGACLSRSMDYALQATRDDRILTVGTFAWITGQSYMLTGPLLAGCRSILMQGSPLGNDGLRWARVAKERGATILKMASAFARHAKASDARIAQLSKLDLPSSLRLATFCAEPVSADVQLWASKIICSRFINSYWGTEHGGIVLTCPRERAFAPDTKCWPVPWVKFALKKCDDDDNGDLGDITIVEPYPGLARTVWGDVEGYAARQRSSSARERQWTGDLQRFEKSYFPFRHTDAFAYVQGDAARYDKADGGWTLHGRSDEVLNVAGVRISVGEIEQVLWRQGISDLAVVGGPDTLKGEVPVAFVVASNDDAFFENGIRRAARDALGVQAEPDVLLVPALPKTVSGKTSRAMLRAMLSTGKLLTEIEVGRSITNSSAYWACARAVDAWRQTRMTSDIHSIFTKADWETMHVDGHFIGGSPLVPGTGWLAALLNKFRFRRVEKVQFLRATRNKDVNFIGRKIENRLEVVPSDDDDGGPYLRCTFATPPSEDKSSLLDLSAWHSDDIVDDIDGRAHYRRCRSVGLMYSGPFESVTRAAWKVDFSFRAGASVDSKNLGALLDSALQVVCCLDAVGPGIAYIPFAVDSVEASSHRDLLDAKRVCVVGAIKARTRTTITADIAYFLLNDGRDELGSFEGEEPILTMNGLSFSALQQSRRRLRGGQQQEHVEETVPPPQKTEKTTSGSILDQILSISGQLTGGSVDPSKSLFENGLYSLRGVELIGRLNAAHHMSLDSHEVAAIETFSELAEYVELKIASAERKEATSENGRGRFSHVNIAALNRIAKARYHGTTGHRSTTTTPLIREAYRALVYMIRRGFLTYLFIQYRDGLVHFMMNPPKTVDLEIEVVVPGLRVAFNQTDYNRHFTVREIVRDSERGFYNLVHASGLAHLEHYYRVMFFASRLEARFDLELLLGENYEMRVTVASVTGPLIDVAVAFHKTSEDAQPQAFVVTWRLMLVIDAETKRMYDFERGSDLPRGEPVAVDDLERISSQKEDTTTPASSTNNRTWAFVVFALLAVYVSCAPLLFRAAYSAFDVASLGISPIEVVIIISALTLWARISFRLDTCDGPIETLLPHG